MKVNHGFVVSAFIAALIVALAKLLQYWILYDRDTFAVTALRFVVRLQIAADVTSVTSAILLCLGLLCGQPNKEPVRKQLVEYSPEPVDYPEWMGR
jgi:hypothetical protein